SGGTPGAPSTPRALEGAGQPDRALLQEFVHFLLTGALQAQWGPGRVRRLEVEPAAADPWGGGDFPAAERAVRLAGGLTGVLAVGVWRPEGAGAAAGADAGGDDALASSLAADLPARMGRLLGIALDASPEAMAADSGG